MDERDRLFDDDEGELDGVSIKAVDILQQKFAVRFRGYDVQDVDSFLEVVAKEVERLAHDSDRMYDELTTLRRELEGYRKKEESINAALVTVQKMADDVKNNAAAESERMVADATRESDKMVSDASVEARKIIDDARQKSSAMNDESTSALTKANQEAQHTVDSARRDADQIRDDLHNERMRIQEEIETLKQRKFQFHASLKALIETHLKLLESESNKPTEY